MKLSSEETMIFSDYNSIEPGSYRKIIQIPVCTNCWLNVKIKWAIVLWGNLIFLITRETYRS